MNYRDIADRYTVRVADGSIVADIDGVTSVEGSDISSLTKNVNMYLYGNVDALVINHMCRLADEKGWDDQEAIDYVAEMFGIGEDEVEALWMDYCEYMRGMAIQRII